MSELMKNGKNVGSTTSVFGRSTIPWAEKIPSKGAMPTFF